MPACANIIGNVLCSEQVMVLHALSSSREILLEELQKLSQAINQPIDMKYISSSKLLGSTLISDLKIPDAEVSGVISSQMSNFFEVLQWFQAKNFFLCCNFPWSLVFCYLFTFGTFITSVLFLQQKLNGAGNFHDDIFFRSLSEVKLLELIDLIGNQVLDLWSIFFKFHRFVLPCIHT